MKKVIILTQDVQDFYLTVICNALFKHDIIAVKRVLIIFECEKYYITWLKFFLNAFGHFTKCFWQINVIFNNFCSMFVPSNYLDIIN